MTSSLPAQSVADLGRTLPETIDRVGQTGQAEVITVDGQPRAVLLSLAAYRGLTREPSADDSDGELGDEVTDEDVRVMRRSGEQHRRGEYLTADAFFDQLHAELIEKQAKQNRDAL